MIDVNPRTLDPTAIYRSVGDVLYLYLPNPALYERVTRVRGRRQIGVRTPTLKHFLSARQAGAWPNPPQFSLMLEFSQQDQPFADYFLPGEYGQDIHLGVSTFVTGNLREKALNELESVASECKGPDWDGYEAEPVTTDTVGAARQFIMALPTEIDSPSVGADPDGQITLEWYVAPYCTVSISVSPSGELHYAALIGESKTYGTEQFKGRVPPPIVNVILRVLAA